MVMSANFSIFVPGAAGEAYLAHNTAWRVYKPKQEAPAKPGKVMGL